MERREEGKVRQDEKSACVRGAGHKHVLKKRRTVKVTVTMLQSGHWSGRSDSGHASPKAYPSASLAWQYRHMLRRSSAAMCEEARERESAAPRAHARGGQIPVGCQTCGCCAQRLCYRTPRARAAYRPGCRGAGVAIRFTAAGRVGAGAYCTAVPLGNRAIARRRASSAGPRPLEWELGASNVVKLNQTPSWRRGSNHLTGRR